MKGPTQWKEMHRAQGTSLARASGDKGRHTIHYLQVLCGTAIAKAHGSDGLERTILRRRILAVHILFDWVANALCTRVMWETSVNDDVAMMTSVNDAKQAVVWICR